MTTKAIELQQKKISTVRQLLQRNAGPIKSALPVHMSADRFLRIALTCLQKTPKLMDCTPESFLGAVMTAAQLGLEPDGITGMAYLIPYAGKVNFQPGFQGLMELARRSGEISQIIPRVVREGDEFRYNYGVDKDVLHHIEGIGETPGAITHVYCIVRMKDGTSSFEVWPVARIEAHRKRYSEASKSKKDSPWETHFEAMSMKTLIIRALKYAPKSVELQKAIAMSEMAEAGIDQRLDSSGFDLDLPPQEPAKTQLEQLTEDVDTKTGEITTKVEAPQVESRPSAQEEAKLGVNRGKAAKIKAEGEQIKEAKAAEKKAKEKAKLKKNKEKVAEIKAEGERKEQRKGLIDEDQIATLQKLALAVGIKSERLVDILGSNYGVERLQDVKTADYSHIAIYLEGLKT